MAPQVAADEVAARLARSLICEATWLPCEQVRRLASLRCIESSSSAEKVCAACSHRLMTSRSELFAASLPREEPPPT